MNVKFAYTPIGGGALKTEPLALGQRLAPLAPVEFSHTGAVQESFPVRAAAKTYFGRGGGSVSESFIAQKEHTSYWAAVVWCRVTLGPMRGASGTLIFESDPGPNGGRISLVGAVCTAAAGHIEGITSFVHFQFVGGNWVTS